jgi:hypothetical protein
MSSTSDVTFEGTASLFEDTIIRLVPLQNTSCKATFHTSPTENLLWTCRVKLGALVQIQPASTDNALTFTCSFGDDTKRFSFTFDVLTASLTVKCVCEGVETEIFSGRIDACMTLAAYNTISARVRDDTLALKINNVKLFETHVDKPFAFSFDDGTYVFEAFQNGQYTSTIEVTDVLIEPIFFITSNTECSKTLIADRVIGVDYNDVKNKPTIPETFTIEPGSITTDMIADNSILPRHITNNAVGTGKILNGAVTLEKLADGVLDYNNISNTPTIPTIPELADVAYTGSYNDLIDKPTNPSLPDLADVALTGSYNDLVDKPTIPGEFTLTDGSVETRHLADSAVRPDKIGYRAVTAPKIDLEAVTNTKISANAISTDKLRDACVTTGKIADGAVTREKLADHVLATSPTMILNNSCVSLKAGERIILTKSEPGSPFEKVRIRPLIDGIIVYTLFPGDGNFYPLVNDPVDLSLPELAAAIEHAFSSHFNVQCTYSPTSHSFTIKLPLVATIKLEGNLSFIMGFYNKVGYSNNVYISDRIASCGGTFGGGLLSGGDNSTDNIIWSKARLMIRGCVPWGMGGSCSLTVQQTIDRGYTWTSLTDSFQAISGSYDSGHRTCVSPWFTLSSTEAATLAIRVDSVPSDTEEYRIGAVYIQFSA